MINYYDRAVAYPEIFKQLICKDLLFVNYDCPSEMNKQDNWSHYTYILHVVYGKKGFHTPNRSWILTTGNSALIKKGACIFEKYFDGVLCLMAFFIPDNYLRSFLQEHISLVPK